MLNPYQNATQQSYLCSGNWQYWFIPRIRGEVQEMIEFTQVLHVPDLHNSLLSILYLTKYWGVCMFIEDGVVKFTLNGTLLFIATAADDQNIAYLDGTVVGLESANFSSSIHTLPLNHDPTIFWTLSLPCTIMTWLLG
jgi:hypothetical protein